MRDLKLDDVRESANVRDAIEGFDVESRKSKDLAEREARLESECCVAWKKAREASDFNSYSPILQDMFALKREVAATTRPDVCSAGEPYDGALDAFDGIALSAHAMLIEVGMREIGLVAAGD